MPASVKTPLGQPSLKEMWGGKRKHKTEESTVNGADGKLLLFYSTHCNLII